MDIGEEGEIIVVIPDEEPLFVPDLDPAQDVPEHEEVPVRSP